MKSPFDFTGEEYLLRTTGLYLLGELVYNEDLFKLALMRAGLETVDVLIKTCVLMEIASGLTLSCKGKYFTGCTVIV